mmetsp:Transcript_70217/g.146331  ORF Transcript_70217/g.146331 Transcript_70217/m.146331 type:complete len:300 (+) Transcript_70217:327-1226(+)
MPHIDMEETKEKGLRMLLQVLLEHVPAPIKVWVKIPVVLSGGKVYTSEGPGAAIYSALRAFERTERVIDASFFVGHQHADETRLGAAVVFTGLPTVESTMAEMARVLAHQYWSSWMEFDFPAQCQMLAGWDSLVEVMQDASEVRPLFVADFGDNTCAGASGDVPFLLRQFVELAATTEKEGGSPCQVLIADLLDAPAVAECFSQAETQAEKHDNTQNPSSIHPSSSSPHGVDIARLRVGAAMTAAAGRGGGGEGEALYGEGCSPVMLENVQVRQLCASALEEEQERRNGGLSCKLGPLR